jgi:hypothetical protein
MAVRRVDIVILNRLFMRLGGFLFLLAGWLNVLMAIALLKQPALAAFLLAGFGLEAIGLALLIRSHLPGRPEGRERH